MRGLTLSAASLALAATLAAAPDAEAARRKAKATATERHAGAANIVRDNAWHEEPTLDLVAVLGLFFGYSHFGVGGWYGYPVLPDGFLPDNNDALFVEAGAMVERYGWSSGVCSWSWYRVTPMGGVRWNVYITRDWTVFGTAKVGYGIGSTTDADCGRFGALPGSRVSFSSGAFDLGVGAYWNFSEDWSARFELGYLGARVGAGTRL